MQNIIFPSWLAVGRSYTLAGIDHNNNDSLLFDLTNKLILKLKKKIHLLEYIFLYHKP